MKHKLLAPLTFFRQTLCNFRTTGAVAPSSRYLARAMVECLPEGKQVPKDFLILEVGAGTGAFTEAIVDRLDGHGRVHLCELNDSFARHLAARLSHERRFARMKDRIQLIHGDVRRLPDGPAYSAIISGLPFNCFTGSEVRGLLEHFRGLLKSHGTLSFFEYLAIRQMQAPFIGAKHRSRLHDVSRVVREFVARHQFHEKVVLVNLPPARVRHLRF